MKIFGGVKKISYLCTINLILTIKINKIMPHAFGCFIVGIVCYFIWQVISDKEFIKYKNELEED